MPLPLSLHPIPSPPLPRPHASSPLSPRSRPSHLPAPPHPLSPPKLGSLSVLHLRVDDVHAIALAPRGSNANAMLGLALLTRTVGAVRAYCGGECTEAALRSNFVLVLELLDEVVDGGVPQLTDPAVLKEFIFQRGLVGGLVSGGGLGGLSASASAKRAAQAAAATLQVTGAVGWRAPGLKYKRNEVFLDVVETVDALVSPRGDTLRASVVGRVMMKAFLSGMPDVKLGLNDRVEVRKKREEREGRASTAKRGEKERWVGRACARAALSHLLTPIPSHFSLLLSSSLSIV